MRRDVVANVLIHAHPPSLPPSPPVLKRNDARTTLKNTHAAATLSSPGLNRRRCSCPCYLRHALLLSRSLQSALLISELSCGKGRRTVCRRSAMPLYKPMPVYQNLDIPVASGRPERPLWGWLYLHVDENLHWPVFI